MDTAFKLIDKYGELPPGRFRELMTQLPQKIQGHFNIILPYHHLDTISGMRRLPIVRLDDDEGILPIPPEYSVIISEMETILQCVYIWLPNRV